MKTPSDRSAALRVALGVAGIAALLLAVIDGAPRLTVDALPGALAATHGVRTRAVQIAPGGAAPWGFGEPVQIWTVATDAEGTHLFHTRGRRLSARISPRGPWRRISKTPTIHRLLAARPDQALVARLDPTGLQTVELHALNGPGGRLRLTRPAKALHAEWTPDGFTVQADDGAITLAQGQVTPAEAAIWLPGAPDPPPRVVDLAPAPPPRFPTGDAGWTQAPGPIAVQIGPPGLALRYRPAGLDAPLDAIPLRWIAAPAVGGLSVDGAVVHPLQRGGTAIWIDPRGQAVIGRFAGEPSAAPAGVLRQAGPPLVMDGRAVVVDPDPSRPRAGLGVRADGRLVVAQADAKRIDLAQALALAGAVQAVEIRPTGLLPTDARPDTRRDWFAVVAPEGLSGARWRAAGWRGLADGRLAIRRHGEVELVLIEPRIVTAQLVPGLAEIGGGASALGASGGFQLIGGVRSARAPYGLKLGDTARRALREGRPGLIIDADGRLDLRAIDGEGPAGASVLQGPLLLRDGAPAVELHSPPEVAISAMGRRVDGRFVFATTQAGTDALIEALRAVDVRDALRLGDRSTADAGQVITPAGRSAFGAPTTPAPWAGTRLILQPAAYGPQVAPAESIRIR